MLMVKNTYLPSRARLFWSAHCSSLQVMAPEGQLFKAHACRGVHHHKDNASTATTGVSRLEESYRFTLAIGKRKKQFPRDQAVDSKKIRKIKGHGGGEQLHCNLTFGGYNSSTLPCYISLVSGYRNIDNIYVVTRPKISSWATNYRFAWITPCECSTLVELTDGWSLNWLFSQSVLWRGPGGWLGRS